MMVTYIMLIFSIIWVEHIIIKDCTGNMQEHPTS